MFIDFSRLSVESGPVPHCSNSKLYPDMVLSVESYAREDQRRYASAFDVSGYTLFIANVNRVDLTHISDLPIGGVRFY